MKKVKSYLDFGYIEGNKKIIYDTKWEQDAYDFFMVPRYMKDMISYKSGDINSIHHKEDIQDNLKKYVALYVCKKWLRPLIFYEIGSSLMGVIESLECINKIYKKLNVKKITFVGVDNSKMMNFGAYYLHKDYKVRLFEEKVIVPCDLFFAKGISLLYAFDNEESFCKTLKNSKIAIFDYTFSLNDESIKSFIGTGKPVTYLSLNKCKKLLQDNKILVLKPSKRKYKLRKDQATYECIYGDRDIVEKYIEKIKTVLPPK